MDDDRPQNVSPYEMWSVEIVSEDNNTSNTINALHSQVRFICVPLGCALTWSKQTLPAKW